MNRKQLTNLLKIVVSISLLTYIYFTLDIPALLSAIRNANVWWLTLALVTMMLTVVARALRWKILLNAIDVPVTLIQLTGIYFIGFLFNNILPSGVGGDAVRMLELRRHTKENADTVTSVLVDRFLGLSALQAIALGGILYDWQAVPAYIAYFTVTIFVVGMVGGLLLINAPLYRWLRDKIWLFRKITDISFIDKLFVSFQRYPLWALGRAYLVSFGFNFMLIALNVFVGLALGAQATIVQYIVIVPITALALLIPFSVGGLGFREGAYQTFFGQVGVPGEIAVAISILIFVIGNICPGLVGGVIYMFRGAQEMVSSSRKDELPGGSELPPSQ